MTKKTTTKDVQQRVIYGMQLRLAGMKRRGADPVLIDALQKKHDALVAEIKGGK